MEQAGTEVPDSPDSAATAQTEALPHARRLPLPLIVTGAVVLGLCGIGAVTVVASPDTNKSPASTASTRAAATTTRHETTPPAVATTAAPTPSAKPESLPADQVFSGRGAKVLKLQLADNYLHVAAITHSGRGNFVVWTVDAAGNRQDLLVNAIGNYSGVRPVDLRNTPAALQIEADGAWKVLLQVAQKVPVWTDRASGKGDAVLRISDRTQGLTIVKVTYGGRGNFVVWVYGSTAELLVNEIGNYSGEVLMPPGMVLIDIEAEGAWTFETLG